MRAVVAGAHFGGGDLPDARLPGAVRGWRAVGVAEVVQDDGAHQAFGLVLESPPGTCKWHNVPPMRLVLWWRREPRREWALTPLSE